jgi:hypothetical protein
MKINLHLFNKIYLIIFLALIQSSCKKDQISWNLIKLPNIKDIVITNNNLTLFEISSVCDFDGYDQNTEKGFCFSTEPNPTLNNDIIISQSKGEGSFTATFNWINSGTYYVRAYAKNKVGVKYSNSTIVNWPGNASNLPVINTLMVNNIMFKSALFSGSIISSGDLPILKTGFFVSTNSNPNIYNSIKINASISSNQFSAYFDSLQNNTTYFVKSFAENIAGTSFGDVVSFTTKKMYTIGEIGPAGGFIFYTKQDTIGNWNFLEAAPIDLPQNFPWHLSNFSGIGLTTTDIGYGQLNTLNLVSVFGNSGSNAAYNSYNFSYNGYHDWFMPSRDELILMKTNLFDRNLGALNVNGNYWSSSEDLFFTQNAWVVKMSLNQNGNVLSYQKSQYFNIRAIRKF